MTWGDARYGGDSGPVQDQLKSGRQIPALLLPFLTVGGSSPGVLLTLVGTVLYRISCLRCSSFSSSPKSGEP